MCNNSLKLTQCELDSILSFHERTGASNILPHPFEFTAIRESWEKICPVLEKVDLLSYRPKDAFQIMAPKSNRNFRPVTIIDPVDQIFFTGLAFRMAPIIEKARINEELGSTYSWRLTRENETREIHVNNEWREFNENLMDLGKEYQFIAITDIVDFFPRIYLHRLENAMVSITKLKSEKNSLMRLLKNWSKGTSYGIPIGPIASNIIAEALLIEVDKLLLSYDFPFLRYVDDYYFFGDSEAECQKFLYILAERLHDSQGLSLNSGKTKIRKSESFLREKSGRKTESRQTREKILSAIYENDPYNPLEYEDLSEDIKKLVEIIDTKEAIIKALDKDFIDIWDIKSILRLFTALKKPELVDLILENLNRLSPISESIARFFNVLDELDLEERVQIGNTILRYIEETEFISEFQLIWLLEPFSNSEEWNNELSLRKIARNQKNRFARCQAILGLGNIGNRSSLLDIRYSLNDTKDWEYRSGLFACRNLPQDERKAFYGSLKVLKEWNLENLLIKATIAYSKALTKKSINGEGSIG